MGEGSLLETNFASREGNRGALGPTDDLILVNVYNFVYVAPITEVCFKLSFLLAALDVAHAE